MKMPVTVQRLLDHERVRATRFDGAAFVYGARRRTGLTRRIAARMRVPLHRRAACAVCRLGNVRASSRESRAHGCAVDDELVAYVAQRRARASLSATALRIVECLETTQRLRLVAAQVPLFVAALGVATAIDLVGVDSDDRVHLIECKATLDTGMSSACYEQPTAPRYVRGPLRSLERSRYATHQLQLWAMRDALVADLDVDVASALIVRASPSETTIYPLNEWFVERSDALRVFLGAKRQRAGHGKARRRR